MLTIIVGQFTHTLGLQYEASVDAMNFNGTDIVTLGNRYYDIQESSL